VLKAANDQTTKSGFAPSRREFAAFGATAAMCSANAAPLAAATVSTKSVAQKVKISGNLFQPETGNHPGLVMFASAAASRSANAAVAHQLASQGWAVMLVEAPALADPSQINLDAHKHVAWLAAQPSVVTSKPVANGHGLSKQGYVLQSFSASHPALSLASREERREANCCGLLFAVPIGALAASDMRRNSLQLAARSLHRLSA
jgi:hypothetical protein